MKGDKDKPRKHILKAPSKSGGTKQKTSSVHFGPNEPPPGERAPEGRSPVQEHLIKAPGDKISYAEDWLQNAPESELAQKIAKHMKGKDRLKGNVEHPHAFDLGPSGLEESEKDKLVTSDGSRATSYKQSKRTNSYTFSTWGSTKPEGGRLSDQPTDQEKDVQEKGERIDEHTTTHGFKKYKTETEDFKRITEAWSKEYNPKKEQLETASQSLQKTVDTGKIDNATHTLIQMLDRLPSTDDSRKTSQAIYKLKSLLKQDTPETKLLEEYAKTILTFFQGKSSGKKNLETMAQDQVRTCFASTTFSRLFDTIEASIKGSASTKPPHQPPHM